MFGGFLVPVHTDTTGLQAWEEQGEKNVPSDMVRRQTAVLWKEFITVPRGGPVPRGATWDAPGLVRRQKAPGQSMGWAFPEIFTGRNEWGAVGRFERARGCRV